MKTYKRVLTIAGSDSGGGAGIQADIKAISANGCYAASVITAVTVQNTLGVQAIHAISAGIIAGQTEAVLSDIGADAVKIGMLPSAEAIEAVASVLQHYPTIPIVLDPVMVATSGDRLMATEAIEALEKQLLPMARVITPNIPEAEALSSRSITSCEEMPEAAQHLAEQYGVSVLLKAGHLSNDPLTDVLYDYEQQQLHQFTAPRTHTVNTHGTGCTLSATIAAQLALGLTLPQAIQKAKEYISKAIAAGAAYSIGHGHGPVNHFFL